MGYTSRQIRKGTKIAITELTWDGAGSCGSFVAQFADIDPEVLTERLNGVTESLENASRKPPIRNTPYVCLFDDDGLWYRAQYEAMFPGDEAGTKKVQVLFVDFGNRQTYSFPNEWITSAKIPTQEFLDPEIMFLQIWDDSVTGPDGLNCSEEKMEQVLSDQSTKWFFVPDNDAEAGDYSGDTFEGTIWAILENGKELKLSDLLAGKEAVEQKVEEQANTSAEQIADNVSTVSTAASSTSGTRYKTKVPNEPKSVWLCANEGGLLWLEREDKEVEKTNFQATLADIVQTQRPLSKAELVEGRACLALSKVYEGWYRAVIIGNEGKQTKVLFVDYGTIEDLDDQILEIPSETRRKSLYALPVVNQFSDCNDTIATIIDSFMSGEGPKMTFHPNGKNSKTPHATLPIDIVEGELRVDVDGQTKPFSEYLASLAAPVVSGVIERESTEIEERSSSTSASSAESVVIASAAITKRESVFLSTAEDFPLYFTKNDQFDALTEFAQSIDAKGHDAPVCENVKIGTPEAYLAPYEGTFCRCRVESQNGEHVQVFFVDYGNRTEVPLTEIRLLPSVEADVPAFAFPCCFDSETEALLKQNIELVRSWESSETVNIEVDPTGGQNSLIIDGLSPAEYFAASVTYNGGGDGDGPGVEPVEVNEPPVRPPQPENQHAQIEIGEEQYLYVMNSEHSEKEGKVTFHGFKMQDETVLISLAEELRKSANVNDPKEYDFRVGDSVLIYDTLFEGDEDFHRCKIIAIDGEGMYFVKLLDYGFTKKVNKVYPDSADHSGPDWIYRGLSLEFAEAVDKVGYEKLKAKVDQELNEKDANLLPYNITEKVDDGYYKFKLMKEHADNEQVVVEEPEEDFEQIEAPNAPAETAEPTKESSHTDEITEPDARSAESPQSVVSEGDDFETFVVLNTRPVPTGGTKIYCLSKLDWAQHCQMKPSTDQPMNPKQMATIDRGHEVLVQCSPINSADSGFRRGTFIGWSDQRGLFNLIDFGKRVLASPAKVFHFDGAAFSGREFVISDPIKIEIGQERDLNLTLSSVHSCSARVATTATKNTVRRQMDRLMAKVDTMDECALECLSTHMKSLLEKFC